MKRISILTLALVFVASLFAAQRTAEQAAEIAAQFTNDQPALRKAHKAPRTAASMRLVHTATKPASTEAAFYVFNQENNAGAIFVSADDRTLDVLGYFDNGQFDPNNINPNLRFWLGRYAEEIANANDDNAYVAPVRKAAQATAISPLLGNIAWDQEAPYYNQCPMDSWDNTRCLTGCVATAASQIMRKWRFPAQGIGSKTYTWRNYTNSSGSKYTDKSLTANFGETTYDWDNMLETYGSSYTAAQGNAVATLMYHAGVACEMMYGGTKAGGSGAWTDDMGYGLKTYFGYSVNKFISTYNTKNQYTTAKGADIPSGIAYEFGVTFTQFADYFDTELEAGRPILMGGEDTDGGHEFVCDGRDASGKYHINWGWSGDCNSYFALTALKPSGTGYNFSSNIDAMLGVEPAQFTVTFNAGTHGTCATASIKEETTGAGITLPAVTATGDYVFEGWSTSADATVADAGLAGALYHPATSCTLYAVYSHPGYANVIYSLNAGVNKTSGAEGEILIADGLTATFTAKDGYIALQTDSANVIVKVNGAEIDDCYSFNAGVLTITLSAAQITGAIQISVDAIKPKGDVFTLVTNVADLAAGDEIIIVSQSKKVAATDISNSIMGTEDVTISAENTIELPDGSEVVVLTLGGSTGAWTFTNTKNQKLGATAVKKLAWGSGTTTWSISISGGDATIQNGTSANGRFLYNSTSPRFTTYSSSTSASMILPQIFSRSGGHAPTPVTPVAVTGVTLDKNTASVQVGSSITLVATVMPENADNKQVTWTSANDAIASVNNGVVTAYEEGVVEITVTTVDGNKSASCIVTIVAADQPVVDPVIAVNCQQAYSATEALDNGSTGDKLYSVTGYITYVYSRISKNQQSFWMDDEEGETQTFQAYWANLPDAVSKFEVGMHVRVTGYLTHYVNNQKQFVPEIKNGDVEILNDETALEELVVPENSSIRKLIHDGQLLIIRDGHLYNAVGQKIK